MYDGRVRFMEARWGTMVRGEFGAYWEDLKGKYKNPSTKKGFNETEKKLNNLLNPRDCSRRPRFFPVGAALAMVLPGQDLTTAGYLIGQEYNEGTISRIVSPIIRLFIRYMVREGIIRKYKHNDKPDKTQKKAERYHKLTGLGNYEDLVAAFLDSDIAVYWVSTEGEKTVNVWEYPR